MWFGEQGVMTLQVSREAIDPDTITIFQWLPTTSIVLWACYLLLIVNIVGLMVGLFTRCQLVCIFVLFTSFVHRNNLIFDGEDIVFRLMAFYLLLSPAGKYLSLDHRIASRRNPQPPKMYPIWPLRLIQIQTAAILFFSGIEKLKGSNWIDGDALYYVSRLDDLFYRLPVPEFVFESLLLMSLLTWATLFLELVIPIAIWFDKTRRVCLVILLAFHLSLDYSMNLNLFHWIMLVGWMSFIRPQDLKWLRKSNGNQRRQQLVNSSMGSS